ncbi:hypothetical protein [Hyalangium rubrum]|uniref:Uncharacterized protein n=1 Tax=Hyalangium rubrum TaxID=3103134 RepID=A0ABU5H3A9_9BACT|nr:hypothetical protein [Hyalangium sp. s54d21]MDY7227957.1 hypothetical protein [Hyalangium sp. s54d21]
MPRGYSYDHFQVPKREPRERATPSDALKAATAKKGEAAPHTESQEGLHYGQDHSETLVRLRAKRQAKATAKKEAPSRGASTKAPTRGGKTVERMATAAKTVVKRVAKKASARKTSKKR